MQLVSPLASEAIGDTGSICGCGFGSRGVGHDSIDALDSNETRKSGSGGRAAGRGVGIIAVVSVAAFEVLVNCCCGFHLCNRVRGHNSKVLVGSPHSAARLVALLADKAVGDTSCIVTSRIGTSGIGSHILKGLLPTKHERPLAGGEGGGTAAAPHPRGATAGSLQLSVEHDTRF